jgi:photosystem II stability/assembly factor-like uncharacterized protein
MMRLCLILGMAVSAMAIAPIQLRLEYSDSIVEESAPRVSWAVSAPGERGVMQSAYQIVISRSDGTKVWDSSKVASNR